MNLVNAINQLRREGSVEYRPMGAQMGANGLLITMDGTLRIPDWSDIPDLRLKKIVKTFYEDNADAFADGYWLVMYDDSGDLVMEVCDEA